MDILLCIKAGFVILRVFNTVKSLDMSVESLNSSAKKIRAP